MNDEHEDRCENCAHWIAGDDTALEGRQGACRAHPPVATVFLLEQQMPAGLVEMAGPQLIPRVVSQWPTTASDQWCGEHKHVETVMPRLVPHQPGD